MPDTTFDPEQGQSVSLEGEISPEFTGMRLDKVAVQLWPDYSRSQISAWIKAGKLKLGGEKTTPSQKVMGGEQLSLHAELLTPERWTEPQAVKFDVIFEDEHLLVIDKPVGLVVHPGAGNRDFTLINGLVRLDPSQAQFPRAGLIHRLDKDTSGLLLVARSSRVFKLLTSALKEHEIKRRYHAVVEGVLTGGMSIELAMGRDPNNRTRQKVQQSGRPAVTHIKVLERYRAHTLVEAELETGRTHQIRVHMSHTGFPLVGDSRYGARTRLPKDPNPALVACIQNFKRQALHARVLEFEHPVTHEWTRCASKRPADLQTLVTALEQDRDLYV